MNKDDVTIMLKVSDRGENHVILNRPVKIHVIPRMMPRVDQKGVIDPLLACHLNSRYSQFRSFSFGCNRLYDDNWGWRCFMAVILVGGNREKDMLNLTQELFERVKTPLQLIEFAALQSKALISMMVKNGIGPVRSKISTMVNGSEIVIRCGGAVPQNGEILSRIKGVGDHTRDVTLAWVHQQGEFGVDLHVRRIMRRMGIIDSNTTDHQIVDMVKKSVPPEKIGHFSRAFVDHGQTVCGHVPNCGICSLRNICPKILNW